MSQETLSRGTENRKYRSLLYKERYSENLNNTNKEVSSKRQGRETLRDLTHKYTRHNNNTNERKIDYKSNFGKDLSSSTTKDELKENRVQITLDTNKFFTELSKENAVIQSFENIDNRNDILKKTYSRINKIIEVENYFEKVYGKNGIKGMTVEFVDLEAIKNSKLSIPEWLLRDNSEELFEAELSPQDITVYNLWFYRRKDEGAPEFVQKGIKPISNADILTHLEKIYNVTREEKRSGTNRNGSRMIRLVLDELRKVNNYMLYIGSETRYPNNVMEKTPKLIEKFERVLERIRLYKNYEKSKDTIVNIVNDEKAIKYAKELLYVSWMNFNVRTRDDSKNRVIFRRIWMEADKELEEIIGKYFNRNKSVGRRAF